MTKKHKSFIYFGIFIVSFILVSQFVSNINTSQEKGDIIVEREDFFSLRVSNYWNNFSFIHIEGNWSNAVSWGWCKGDGSWGNPYIIENMTIDATSSPVGGGILISNSANDYFIINNCPVKFQYRQTG